MTLAIIFDSVGAGEWFVLLAVLLVVMGPKRLPSAARQFGSYYSKFRRAAVNFRRQLMEMDTELEREVASMTEPPKGIIPDEEQVPSATPSESEPGSAEYGRPSTVTEPESSNAD